MPGPQHEPPANGEPARLRPTTPQEEPDTMGAPFWPRRSVSAPADGTRVRRAGRVGAAVLAATAVLGGGAALSLLAPAAGATDTATIVVNAGNGQTTKVGTAFSTPLSVEVECDGIAVDDGEVVFSAPSSGASGSFSGQSPSDDDTVTTATTEGVYSAATFTADATSGSYDVSAELESAGSSGCVTGNGTVDFLLTNTGLGVASVVTAEAPVSQSAAIGTTFSSPLEAEVTDAYGNVVSGVNVTFAVQASNGASATFATGGSSATEETGSNGIATSPELTAGDTAGSYTVVASVQGVTGTATFSLTNTAGTPATVTAGVGASQQTPAGSAFPIPLAVTVTDADKNPVEGAVVTFAAPSSGASGTFAGAGSSVVVDTDGSGVAVAPTFMADSTVGGYVVTATVAGVTQPAVFTLVNDVPSGGSASGTGTTTTPTSTTEGYRQVTSSGAVFAYGNASYLGGANTVDGGAGPGSPVVALTATPDGGGYWEVTSAGAVFAYGDAGYLGGANTAGGGAGPGSPVVGMAATADGRGYWEVTSSGAVFAYGDAGYLGGANTVDGGAGPGSPVVALTATPDGGGYWEVTSAGAVFAYGDAGYLGGANTAGGGAGPGSPVVGTAATADGRGYWEVTSSGAVFAYGDAGYLGGANAVAGGPGAPVVSVVPTPDGRGYWEVTSAGAVFAYGDAPYLGGANTVDAGAGPGVPVVATSATAGT